MSAEVIQSASIPKAAHDYLIQHDYIFVSSGRKINLSIRMVPDRDIIKEGSLTPYLARFSDNEAPLEILAGQLLDDLLNALIPRFLQMELYTNTEGNLHRVVMKEKQPKWENPGLLSRLKPL